AAAIRYVGDARRAVFAKDVTCAEAGDGPIIEVADARGIGDEIVVGFGRPDSGRGQVWTVVRGGSDGWIAIIRGAEENRDFVGRQSRVAACDSVRGGEFRSWARTGLVKGFAREIAERRRQAKLLVQVVLLDVGEQQDQTVHVLHDRVGVVRGLRIA